MHHALVEDSQDEIHGDQRGEDEEGLVLERRLESARGALEGAGHAGGRADLCHAVVDRPRRGGERGVGRQVERDRRRRERALVRDV